MITIPDDLDYDKEFALFYEWISDKNNDHGYWLKDCEGNLALSFGTEEFINWLVNKYGDVGIEIVKTEEYLGTEDEYVPHIFF